MGRGAGMPDPTIKELVSSSGFSFAGAVESTGNAGASGLPADDRTAVVQVEQVLHAPGQFTVPPGGKVIVQMSADLPPLSPGDRATFFTNGLAYGDELVVTEVGRLPADAGAARTESMAGVTAPVSAVEAALAELAQDDVADHVAQAAAAVRGHVSALAEVSQDGPRGEHDAQWWTATLEVDLVARGDIGGSPDAGPAQVVVLYANSLDVRWRDWPKPKAGQGGLWLLHRTPTERAQSARFELEHAIDLQPSLQLDLLRERGM
jgi:hypothetical protein